jgi:uncharacterized metal-binding protein YceD (DUF177 family)
LHSRKLHVMAAKREFEIAFVGLKPGLHEFNYVANDQFFKDRENTTITNTTATVKLTLEKNSGFMMLKFDVGGQITVDCDRCGNPLPQEIWDEFNLVVKLVDNADEMNLQEEDPDVFYLNRNESHLDVAPWIYEFVLLSIPQQSTCNAPGNTPHCNVDVLNKLKQMEEQSKLNSNTIWSGLEKFKTKN